MLFQKPKEYRWTRLQVLGDNNFVTQTSKSLDDSREREGFRYLSWFHRREGHRYQRCAPESCSCYRWSLSSSGCHFSFLKESIFSDERTDRQRRGKERCNWNGQTDIALERNAATGADLVFDLNNRKQSKGDEFSFAYLGFSARISHSLSDLSALPDKKLN